MGTAAGKGGPKSATAAAAGDAGGLALGLSQPSCGPSANVPPLQARSGTVPPNPAPVLQPQTWGGFETVGGLQKVVQQLREMVILPLQYPELFKHLGIAPPR